MLRIALAQINPHIGHLDHNRDLIIDEWRKAETARADLVLFPELAITGYSPEDLLLKPSFIHDVNTIIDELVTLSRSLKSGALIPAPIYNAIDHKLYNGVYLIHGGKILNQSYKHHLPNYGVFDDMRYFTAGHMPTPMIFQDHKLGVMICEDMWAHDVADHLCASGCDLLIALNASPFEQHKHDIRNQYAARHARTHQKHLIYLNQVGGQDDLVYDGASFVMNETGKIIHNLNMFTPDFSIIEFEHNAIKGNLKITPPQSEQEQFYNACVLGLKDYLQKSSINKVILGLSGGIDSALVATIAADAIGRENVLAIMLPSPFTSNESLNDAALCAKNLGINYQTISIEPLMAAFESSVPSLNGLAHENMQSRLRGNILMTLSNQNGHILLTTGNKSEMAMGYATLYGDMCGGYNPIKDLYKTQVVQLCKWRNEMAGYALIPETIISKPPTAELKPNQKDEDSLPPYDTLDQILYGLIEMELSAHDLIEAGHNPEMVRRVQKSLYFAEYKRKQAPLGTKISGKAFTRERRYPIVNGYKEKEN